MLETQKGHSHAMARTINLSVWDSHMQQIEDKQFYTDQLQAWVVFQKTPYHHSKHGSY